jgi:sphinganine C4-monooxygenase
MAMNTTHLDSPRPAISILEQNPHTPLLPFISDAHLLLLLPTAAYWAYGLLFHWIDQRGYLARYKLHTPAEILKRNKVPMFKVISSILFYQSVVTLLGFWMLRGSKPDPQGNGGRDIALWALWLSQFRKFSSLSGWAFWRNARIESQFSVYSGSDTEKGDIFAISMLELIAAKSIYYFLVPLAQFTLAVFVADTWQYFTHRIVHTNQYLYGEFYQPFSQHPVDEAGGHKCFEEC